MNQKSICYNDWEIPHSDKPPQAPVCRNSGWQVFWVYEGRKKRRFDPNLSKMLKFLFRIAASSFPLFTVKRLSSRANPPLSFTDIWRCWVDESRDLQGLNEFLKITLLDKEEKLFYADSHCSPKFRLMVLGQGARWRGLLRRFTPRNDRGSYLIHFNLYS